MALFWLKGLVLGFSIAAPVGPIGLLCIRRTLTRGRLAGLLSGLGAASADALYGALAVIGIAGIHQWINSLQVWLGLLGGCFLVWMGWHILRSPLQDKAAGSAGEQNLVMIYLSTFLLTLSNPMTILAFMAVFSGAGVVEKEGGAILVLGVFCGSTLWWLLLSQVAHFLGRSLKAGWLKWVNILAGLAILAFGLVSIWNQVMGLWK
jgi:threonine/homoserine/homoserine lactone efflux protein